MVDHYSRFIDRKDLVNSWIKIKFPSCHYIESTLDLDYMKLNTYFMYVKKQSMREFAVLIS